MTATYPLDMYSSPSSSTLCHVHFHIDTSSGSKSLRQLWCWGDHWVPVHACIQDARGLESSLWDSYTSHSMAVIHLQQKYQTANSIVMLFVALQRTLRSGGGKMSSLLPLSLYETSYRKSRYNDIISYSMALPILEYVLCWCLGALQVCWLLFTFNNNARSGPCIDVFSLSMGTFILFYTFTIITITLQLAS